jgi:hypothetical protein
MNRDEKAEKKIKSLTGIAVSHSTRQRLVHRYHFEELSSNTEVEEMSIDGGKVRLRTAKGEPLIGRDYQGVSFHQLGVAAFFQDNSALLDFVNSQVLANPLVCLGDGHDGIWNLFREIGEKEQRLEILDWYHLMENLYKVGESFQGIEEVKSLLWQGKVKDSISCFEGCSGSKVGSLILCVISLTYIGAIDLCVLCVFLVRSTGSPAELYLRIHFTHQTRESQKLRILSFI